MRRLRSISSTVGSNIVGRIRLKARSVRGERGGIIRGRCVRVYVARISMIWRSGRGRGAALAQVRIFGSALKSIIAAMIARMWSGGVDSSAIIERVVSAMKLKSMWNRLSLRVRLAWFRRERQSLLGAVTLLLSLATVQEPLHTKPLQLYSGTKVTPESIPLLQNWSRT